MRRIDAGVSGSVSPHHTAQWEDLKLGRRWEEIIGVLAPNSVPRPVQSTALGGTRILDSRRNVIVSAPTNGGKSLVGLLVLLEAVQRGRRAVLLEPLRAIAREKHEELNSISDQLSKILGRPVQVHISTGDYRLDDETYASPPPNQGELLIATPERLDAILRNPEYQTWTESIAAVCVDEAHMISSPKRGSTLEYVVTSLIALPAPPRVVLLSATMGDISRAQAWLAPCDAVEVTDRYPPLHKEVLALQDKENATQIVISLAKVILGDTETCLLVFVYQTRSADHLAEVLRSALDGADDQCTVLSYHAKMSANQRFSVRQAVYDGRCRCVVTTTALALGVNLPATHVLVRDTTFAGVGPLDVADLLQMMGRAGRGDRNGYAAVLVRPSDSWIPEDLALALQQEKLPDLVSSFDRVTNPTDRSRNETAANTEIIATHVASYLARFPECGRSPEEVSSFFQRSLGGQGLASRVARALHWLSDPLRALAYRGDDDSYRLTTLGLKASRAVLPLRLAGGFAQLIRDILTIDDLDRLLASWRPLDHLLLLDLLYGRAPNLRHYSAQMASQVDAWMEQHPSQVPLTYREWIAGQPGSSRAIEVLGSLGVDIPVRGSAAEEWARKAGYRAVFRAILLYERGQGKSLLDLERHWRIQNLEGVQERWRDDMLWLLSGLARILDLRCFYYHLLEECEADRERVRRVKRLMRRLQRQVWDLQENVKYCSALGPMLRSLRTSTIAPGSAAVGLGTIRRLEEAGIDSVEGLLACQLDDLVRLGIRRDRAKLILAYARRRLQ